MWSIEDSLSNTGCANSYEFAYQTKTGFRHTLYVCPVCGNNNLGLVRVDTPTEQMICGEGHEFNNWREINIL